MDICRRTLKKPFTRLLPSCVALFCSAYSPNALQPTSKCQLLRLIAKDLIAWHRRQLSRWAVQMMTSTGTLVPSLVAMVAEGRAPDVVS